MIGAQFRNSAVSATTSSYTSQCVNDFVPEDADLILVEFSVNDWEVVDPVTFTWMDNSLRQANTAAQCCSLHQLLYRVLTILTATTNAARLPSIHPLLCLS